MGVEEFSIHVSENELEDLKRRLSSAKIPKNVERKNWNFGTNAEYLAEVINYWKNSYDWRNIEQKLNGFHHFQTTISNIRIHYIHEKGKSANSIPIILTHGWPDSFLRYTKLIPLLTDPEKFG
ncbi:CLL_collapsed_G0000020.mRNA.1.CDS.1 [Saccharomyces cerevisiae]|nr:CLL_collapsed_G0000020.mRNA.1.CDS.1 [Saccharomyces cerevisiae]